MKKYSLFGWATGLVLLLSVTSQALGVQLKLLNPEQSAYGDFNVLAVGIANENDCSNFTNWGNMSIDNGQNVCLGIALVTQDGWTASRASTVKIASNCAIPYLTNYPVSISGNEINIYVSYPFVAKDTVFSLNLTSNSTAVKDQGDFTLTVTCTQSP